MNTDKRSNNRNNGGIGTITNSGNPNAGAAPRRVLTRAPVCAADSVHAAEVRHRQGIRGQVKVQDWLRQRAIDSVYTAEIEQRQAIALTECREVQSRARTRKLFGLTTALKLCGIELPRGISGLWESVGGRALSHCTMSNRQNLSRMRGTKAHYWASRFAPICVVPARGPWPAVYCAHPLDAWLQLAAYLSLGELVVLAESIIRALGPMINVGDFTERLFEGFAGFHGRERCRQAIVLIRGGADSSQETRLRLRLVAAGLGSPLTQFAPGVCWPGGPPMRYDMAYPQERLLIEYDGDHHRQKAQWNRDHLKDQAAQARGWVVMRFDSETLDVAGQVVHLYLRSRRHTSSHQQITGKRRL